MTPNEDRQNRELLERYGQASRADPRAPSAAVRAAILDEGRRVAAESSQPADGERARQRTSRWKMTAWGTAAASLLAALIIAPRLWTPAPPVHVARIGNPVSAFNQAARKTEAPEAATEPRPEVPIVPVPAPRAESIAPRLAEAPSLRRSLAPPAPVHMREQIVEISPLNQNSQSETSKLTDQPPLSDLARAKSANSGYAAGSDSAQRSTSAATPLLSAAAAAGDLVKTTQLLDQGAAINEQDASGHTPLMLAIGQHQVDAVRLLLDRGADPNESDRDGLSPLQLAQQSNLDDIAALLLKAGAR